MGRLIKTVHPNSVVVESGAEAVHTYTHTGYDYLGRKVWESNPVIEELPEDVNDSEIKIYQYDAASRLITVTLPKPTVCEYCLQRIYRREVDERSAILTII